MDKHKPSDEMIKDLDNLSKSVKEILDISIFESFLALLITEENSQGVYIRSYYKEDIKKKKFIKNKIVRGKIYSEESNEIIIGYALANKLNLKINV